MWWIYRCLLSHFGILLPLWLPVGLLLRQCATTLDAAIPPTLYASLLLNYEEKGKSTNLLGMGRGWEEAGKGQSSVFPTLGGIRCISEAER